MRWRSMSSSISYWFLFQLFVFFSFLLCIIIIPFFSSFLSRFFYRENSNLSKNIFFQNQTSKILKTTIKTAIIENVFQRRIGYNCMEKRGETLEMKNYIGWIERRSLLRPLLYSVWIQRQLKILMKQFVFYFDLNWSNYHFL